MSELQNKENYKKTIDNSLQEIMQIYIRIFVDYFHFMKKTEKLDKRHSLKFILLRGIETISNVFNYMLFSTKNLAIVECYAEKSMFYYIEFISQISEDQHAFLQFSSRDAVIYVYKKTIYEIKNAFVSEITDKKTKDICDSVNKYAQLFKNIAGEEDDLLHADAITKFKKIHFS